MNTDMVGMRDYSGIAELCKIYRNADAESRKKIAETAAKLFYVQKTPVSYSIAKNRPKPRAYRISVIPGFLVMGLLLVFTAYAFWIILINPALLMVSNGSSEMIRIAVTAICGMFIICTGLVWFMIRKITIPWMLLAIGAGVLCVDPRALTDFMGFAVLALIAVLQIIGVKHKRPGIAK